MPAPVDVGDDVPHDHVPLTDAELDGGSFRLMSISPALLTPSAIRQALPSATAPAQTPDNSQGQERNEPGNHFFFYELTVPPFVCY